MSRARLNGLNENDFDAVYENAKLYVESKKISRQILYNVFCAMKSEMRLDQTFSLKKSDSFSEVPLIEAMTYGENNPFDSPDFFVDAENRTSILKKMLIGIPEKHRIMFIELWGLEGNEHRCTLQDIADRYGCTRERVRQITSNIMTKLKRKAALGRKINI